uniref:Uncharacterized protein n=1 Tax=Romanomermis culicivorax TaxID=13658 RepID=A0A915KY18_ROMCU
MKTSETESALCHPLIMVFFAEETLLPFGNFNDSPNFGLSMIITLKIDRKLKKPKLKPKNIKFLDVFLPSHMGRKG